MEFPLSCFRSWKMMLWKCCTQYAIKFEKLATGLERWVFIPIPKEGNAKECSNYCIFFLISHARKAMLKILQARLQKYMSFQVFKLVLEKAEEPKIKLPTSAGSSKKQEFQKIMYFCFIDYAKAFDCVDHNKLENSEGDGTTRPPDLLPEKPVCKSGSNS